MINKTIDKLNKEIQLAINKANKEYNKKKKEGLIYKCYDCKRIINPEKPFIFWELFPYNKFCAVCFKKRKGWELRK